MMVHSISVVARMGSVALLAIVATACSSGPIAQPGLVPIAPVAALGQDDYSANSPAPYRLRPSDVISITVFREENLSVPSLVVSGDGAISLPLVGMMNVDGMTIEQVEARIEQVLGARYLREPEVAVNILAYNSHQVTVDGAVENVGVYDFRPGTRLSSGISLAGGLNRVARSTEVAVFRETSEGMAVAKFDYQAIRSGTMLDPVLEPGDRIVVGTDNLSQFWQDVLRAIPLFALFTRV